MSKSRSNPTRFLTFVELLRFRATHRPRQVAFAFLNDDGTEKDQLTYGQLDQRARAIAAQLQSLKAHKEPAILLYPTSLEFISGFFGCLYAGCIAVPAYPPHPNQSLFQLKSIAADARATVMLTTTQLLSRLDSQCAREQEELKGLRRITTDNIADDLAQEWRNPRVNGETLAFLQYTSGSTNAPKGVMVSHKNILYNERMIQEAFELNEQSTYVGWLPLYHDMGLMGSVLQPIYLGASATLMSPTSFLHRPFRWLQAISDYKAGISGAPNFAYDLCVQRTTPERRATLDLSSWSLAFNGAEPLHSRTLDQFALAFESCGFRRNAFYPCYGLAEATLFVSGGQKADLPIVRAFDASQLERDIVVETGDRDGGSKLLVSCGQTKLDQKIIIVDPDSSRRCSRGQVGEIWISGPNVTQGYWNRPDETKYAFQAHTADSGDGPFLRTGDLGFLLDDGNLFVTGRLKDLVIIRGRNHYPQDIEQTISQSHLLVRQEACAAFSIEEDNEELLVVVAEVKRNFKSSDTEDVIGAIRQAIADRHGIETHAISLVRAGSMPKTTSGKIRHFACRAGFLAGSLKIKGDWSEQTKNRDSAEEQVDAGKFLKPYQSSHTEETIQAWLVSRIAERMGIEPQSVSINAPFTSYGLDSLAAVSMAADLEAFLGRRLSPTLAYDHPTIESLARHLVTTDISVPTTLQQEVPKESVAIIGIGCRFPRADDPQAFWQLLCDGVDGVTDFPLERWNSGRRVDAPGQRKARTTHVNWGAFLDHIDQFDPSFFGISGREAIYMDPQQRMLLEVAWEAFEDAGQVPERLAGTKAGVFVGISTSEYGSIIASGNVDLDPYAITGNALSIAANRLSYFFDFRGPSMAIDTACSSSLVAVHHACHSLWSGESTIAIAGGANLILSSAITAGFSKGGATSSDGRCKAFDAGANGIVRGEGVALVVLKPLSKAVADGDPIYALIRGSAVNQDGRTNGITAPSQSAQEALLRQAYQSAALSPHLVQYIETHGTGTLLGDPIEAKALGSVLAEGRRSDRPCSIGSVKTNIGHLEAAAGIASLIKVALSLKHRAIPPSLHYVEPNPYIPFDDLLLRVQQALGPWPEDDSGPPLAGVSAFGFGGVNAHIVLQGPPLQNSQEVRKEDTTPGRTLLLPLSAHSLEALGDLTRAYRKYLSEETFGNSDSLEDFCYTASVRRNHHHHRLAVVGKSREDLIQRCETFLKGELGPGVTYRPVALDRRRKFVFVFSGHGAQWWAMGRDLLKQEPVFQSTLAECDEFLREHDNWSLLEEMTADESHSRLGGDNLEINQVSLFALQVALSALWRSWGILPDAVVGHSMGETAAAYVAGALTLQEAVRVSFHRAHLMQQGLLQPHLQGAMAAVELSAEEAGQLLEGYEDRISIAAHNAPNSIVLSGDAAALDEVSKSLRRKRIFCRVLNAPGAGHSPQIETIRKQLVKALQGLKPQAATTPIFSTVTGRFSKDTDFDAQYWGRNIRQPVLFSKAIDALSEAGYESFLEISPHPILSNSITQCLRHRDRDGQVLPSLRRNEADKSVMLETLGHLYTLGAKVGWTKLYPAERQHVQLPSYPWQRERFWVAMEETDESFSWKGSRLTQNGNVRHPLMGRHLALAQPSGDHLWQTVLDTRVLPYLKDHQVTGSTLLPGTLFVEVALAAASEIFGSGSYVLTKVEFQRALFLPQSGQRAIQVALSPTGNGEASFQIYSRPAGLNESKEPWILHAVGRIAQDSKVSSITEATSLKEIQHQLQEEISGKEFYGLLSAKGLHYGPFFQGVERLWRRNGEALGFIRVPEALVADVEDYNYHPAVLDSCLQVLGAAVSLKEINDGKEIVGLPTGMDQIRIHERPGLRMWSHARLRPSTKENANSFYGDISVRDEKGSLIAEITGFRIQNFESSSLPIPNDNSNEWLYELQWQLKSRVEPEQVELGVNQDGRGSWLILGDTQGFGDALAARLRAKGQQCVLVCAGKAYEEVNGKRLQFRRDLSEEISQLFDAASHPDQAPFRGIVHLRSLDSVPPEQTTVDSIRVSNDLGSVSVLHLVQELTRRKFPEPPRLWLITKGAQAVTDQTLPLAVAQAPLWGFGRTLAQEHSNLWGGLVDLDPEDLVDDAADLLCDELLGSDGEDQLAFRSGDRFVARLIRKRDFDHQARPLPWRTDGSYLISGGLGDLGLQVARWMVEQGARRLVLLGRTSLPPRINWPDVPKTDRLASQIGAIRELENMGASVHYSSVDVADEQQLSSFLERFRLEGWPPIRGVVHAAGVARLQTIMELDHDSLEEIMQPKVIGGWLLHTLLKDDPLDFFILFSSFSSLLSSPRLSHYAAANSFLDALAFHRRALGLHALSINWGAWSEVGMATRFIQAGRLPLEGLGAFSPKQALDILFRLLQFDATQVGVMRVDWERWHRLYPMFTNSPMLSSLTNEGSDFSAHERHAQEKRGLMRAALLAAEPGERQQLLEAHLLQQLGGVLKLSASKLDAHQPLNTLGIDSLVAIELKKQVEDDIGVTLPIVTLLEGPSIAQLATHIIEELESGASRSLPVSRVESLEQTLANVDQLSEERVDALLNEMLAQE